MALCVLSVGYAPSSTLHAHCYGTLAWFFPSATSFVKGE